MEEYNGLIALNFNYKGGALPEVIDILPPPTAGRITGQDGRSWPHTNHETLIRAFAKAGIQLPIDINHATEIRAPQGDPSPAVGWITQLFDAKGTLKAKVSWTSLAAQVIGDGQYKYISPAFVYSKNQQRIIRLKSAALVNHPNLAELAALNNQKEGVSMKKIAQALGLRESATEEEILETLTQRQAEQQALNSHIPKADYELALNRAEEAEAKLKAAEEAGFKEALNTALDEAIKGAKVAPSSRQFYEETITNQTALNSFKEMVDTSPALLTTAEVTPASLPSGRGELNSVEKAMACAMGLSLDEAKDAFKGIGE